VSNGRMINELKLFEKKLFQYFAKGAEKGK
jgi:hypothetical protein